MAREPIGDLLGAGRLGIGVVRRAEGGDTELDRDHLARRRVDNGGFLAGGVDEARVAGAVDLAHRQAPPLEPASVDLAEPGITVAVRMLLEVLQVEPFEGDAGRAPLGMQGRAVGDGAVMRGRGRRPVQARVKRRLAERRDLRPVEPGGARTWAKTLQDALGQE